MLDKNGIFVGLVHSCAVLAAMLLPNYERSVMLLELVLARPGWFVGDDTKVSDVWFCVWLLYFCLLVLVLVHIVVVIDDMVNIDSKL